MKHIFLIVALGLTMLMSPTAHADSKEDGFWNSVVKGNLAEEYELYLDQYPKGKYATEARRRVDKLKGNGADTPEPPVRTGADATPEDVLWATVKQNHRAEEYQAYLQAYPQGRFVQAAKVQMQKLAREGEEAARKADDEAWRNAEALGSSAAIQRYLDSFPQGRHRGKAEPLQERVRQNEVRVAEDTAWKTAEAKGDWESYKAYGDAYPKGAYQPLLQLRVNALESKEWAEVEKMMHGGAFERFIKRYPAGRYVSEARTRLEIAKKEEADASRPGGVFKDCTNCPAMVVIPAGSFEMGSNSGGSDERPVHSVRIAKPFALAKTEVTQGQWRAVMGSNPSHFSSCGDDCPVENVSWNDAQNFIRTLSQKTGKSYRLPSEAEWEFACRAGGTHTYCGSDNIDSVAWYSSISGNKTHPVAGKQPNAWGLYDMSGNVWERVEDCWNANYDGAPSDGSARTSGSCAQRVQRGGSWINGPKVVGAALRSGNGTTSRGSNDGFRPARMLP